MNYNPFIDNQDFVYAVADPNAIIEISMGLNTEAISEFIKKLNLVHELAKISCNGKTVEFDFVVNEAIQTATSSGLSVSAVLDENGSYRIRVMKHKQPEEFYIEDEGYVFFTYV